MTSKSPFTQGVAAPSVRYERASCDNNLGCEEITCYDLGTQTAVALLAIELPIVPIVLVAVKPDALPSHIAMNLFICAHYYFSNVVD